MPRSSDAFATVRVEGAILPIDLLQRVAAGDARLEGLRPEDYHLVGEKVNEATNHAWNRLLPVWEAFRAAADKLPARDCGQSLTLTKWLLPLWRTLEYGQLEAAKPFAIDDKSYPISHLRYHSPIHLVSFRQDLDKRVETTEGKRPSPYGLVQELLNRSEQYLWGFVSNGLRLRILRDNIRLTRQAFVEFDLQAMFDGKVYADFALLWRLCHESRVMADKPEQCWLERWSKAAQEQGLRALDQLRGGVEKAIEALGRGFLHPNNTELLGKLRGGTLKPLDYYRQLLRLVYRLLFLFVAEDRGLLFDPHADEVTRDRYTRFYSAIRLRRIAEQTRGTQHTDLYRGLQLVLDRLGTSGCPELGLPALGGLFDPSGTSDLMDCGIANADFLEAVRALSVVDDERARSKRPVGYRNLGSEELGSVYESLLELHPRFTPDPPTFVLTSASGHERKTTGSYYTPTSLITCLLDSALDPVLNEATTKPDPEKAILDLKVCDPACGSGHFLIAAAHRIAKKLAAVRTHEDEPAPDAVRHALRDVIGHCIFGVDINPMAVELCQVALWMEALEPGKPLSFLKHHIQCGNSLLGVTPALLAKGIPDAAFEPIEGDDKQRCRAFKKQNKEERQGQGDLFADLHRWERLGDAAAALVALDALPDDTAEQVRVKERQYEKLIAEGSYRTSGHFLADLWCAAFVWKKTRRFDYPITERIFRRVEKSPHDVTPWMYDEVRRLTEQYQFFHWHLAFPGVFRPPAMGEKPDNELTGWCGGFDVVLGNPPWVRQELLKPVKQLLRTFDAYKSTADASVYFLERACQITRISGIFGMLTPNKWFRADYADGLRAFLRERVRTRLIIDFGHTRTLFPDADTFPAAVVFAPVSHRMSDLVTFCFVRAHDSDRQQSELGSIVQDRALAVPHAQLQRARWELEDPRTSELLRRLRATGSRLSQVTGRTPLYGLKTGYNEAFYIDTATRDRLVVAHPECAGLIRRFLRGRDVQRWVIRWSDQWHIVIPSSQNHPWPWSKCQDESEAERTFELAYPSLYQHLKRFEKELRSREDQGRFWWELRACDYYALFDQPKLVVQCIAYHSQFAFDVDCHIINNKVIFIPSGDLYILAVLNSRVMWWIVSRVFQHMKDEGLSVDVQFLIDLPVPNASDDLKELIRQETAVLLALVRAEPEVNAERIRRECRINDLVEQAFMLSDSELDLLRDSLPPRDPLVVLHEAVKDTAVEALTAAQVDILKAMLYIIAFLRTLNRRVRRDILEAGLVLMIDDDLREAFLSNRPVPTRKPGRKRSSLLKWLPLALDQLARTNRIEQDIHEGMPLIKLGPAANDRTGDDVYHDKAARAIQVIARLGEQPARQAVEESVDESANLIPF